MALVETGINVNGPVSMNQPLSLNPNPKINMRVKHDELTT